jgi:hypothetical protein
VAALFTERDEIRVLELELGVKVERGDVMHLELVSAAAALTGRLTAQMASPNLRPALRASMALSLGSFTKHRPTFRAL